MADFNIPISKNAEILSHCYVNTFKGEKTDRSILKSELPDVPFSAKDLGLGAKFIFPRLKFTFELYRV